MGNISDVHISRILIICAVLTTGATKCELVIDTTMSGCETHVYDHYKISITDNDSGRWIYVGKSDLYSMMRKGSLRKESDLLVINTTYKGTRWKAFHHSDKAGNSSESNITLNVFVCERTCYNSLFTEYDGIPEYCEDMKSVSRMSVSVIKRTQWKTVVIVYSNATVDLLNKMHRSLAESDVFVLSYNYDLMRGTDAILKFTDDIYRKLYEHGINVTVICGNNCIKNIIREADGYDLMKDNFRRTSMKQRSSWLLIAQCAINNDVINILYNSSHLDNVAVLDLYTPSEYLGKESPQVIGVDLKSALKELLNMNDESLPSVLEALVLMRFMKPGSVFHPLHTLMWYPNGRGLANVGHVSGNETLIVTSNDFFPNLKYGFNGQRFSVTTYRWKPFVDARIENGTVVYFGFCIDLLDELARILNFTYSLSEPPDNEWGRIRKNGTWTGMIGELEMRRVDLMMAPASIQAGREMAMDFTYPFYFDTTNFLIKRPDPDRHKWLVYINPFHWQVYVCIALALPVCALLLYLTEKYNPFFRDSSESPHSFQYGFWYMYGALLTQGGEDPPSAQSSRALVSTWWLFSLVVVATYTGNLMAFLTVSKDKLPLTSLEEVGSQSTYKWGTLGGSYFITWFEYSTLPSFQRIWSGLKEMNKSDPTVLHADADVHIKKVKTENYIYIGDKISMEARMSNDCSLVISKEAFPNMNYGVGLPNNSLHTELFSKTIMAILERGIYMNWKFKHWPVKTVCEAETTAKAKSIRIIDVQSAFYLIATGIFIAFVILIIELSCKKLRDKHKNSPDKSMIQKQVVKIDKDMIAHSAASNLYAENKGKPVLSTVDPVYIHANVVLASIRDRN